MIKNCFNFVQRRLIHQVPRLLNQETILNEGIEGLFSAAGVQVGWKDYQKYLTTKLSMLTIGTDFENKNAFQILKDTALRPEFSPVFHYASQSHNNHLFYQQLVNKKDNKSSISQELLLRINEKFGSVQDFQASILTELDLLNGQGWVFLVEKLDKSLEIIPCLNDGSPYFYGRNQSLDLNGPIHLSDAETLNQLSERIANKEPDYNLPLLAINCWDYAYLTDYGINGRADYLENLWSCINWEVVNDRMFNLNKLNELL